MKKPTKGKYKQGKYKPINESKYIGDKNDIVYRSSWELSFFKYCDLNPAVTQWNSESFVIPYYYHIDKKMHRYYVDIAATFKQKDGSEKTFLIEIKPYKETIPPKPPKRKTKKSMDRYRQEVLTWEKNKAKWNAAREYCKKHGLEFMILTENELFTKTKSKK